MFTTTAVALTIGIAKWLKWRTDEIKGAMLVTLLGVVLIAGGITADRMGIPKIATSHSRDVKVFPAVERHTCHPRPGATWVICELPKTNQVALSERKN